VTKDREKYRTAVDTVMNLWIAGKGGNRTEVAKDRDKYRTAVDSVMNLWIA
jgi:hypothetical protein